MYVCGLTVYDFVHIGHARMLLVFDMVSRYLRHRGYNVTYVRNITDIDDKIIKRAVENGESISQLTQRFITAMDEDAAALGVQRPDREPRATNYVPQMLNLIEKLEKNIDQVGLVHIADVPGRHEPGTGEIYYPNIYRKLAQLKYTRYAAMEFLPTGDPVTKLREAREEVLKALA